MNDAEARECLKQAAGQKTYPISRALTSPTIEGALMSVPGATLGMMAGSPAGPAGMAIGGLAGAGLGWAGGHFAQIFRRFVSSRALASRALRKDPHLMVNEEETIREMLRAKLPKTAAGRFPYSEALTSRRVHAGVGATRGLLETLRISTTNPALAGAAAPILIGAGAGSGALSAALSRWIDARALRGRLAIGAKGLTPSEKKMIELLQGERRKSIAKKVGLGVGAAALGAGAAYAGTKALSSESA